MPRATRTTSSRSSVTGPVTPMIMAPHTRSVPPAPYSASGGRRTASLRTAPTAGATAPRRGGGRGRGRPRRRGRRRGADPGRRQPVSRGGNGNDGPDRGPDGPADRPRDDGPGADDHHR